MRQAIRELVPASDTANAALYQWLCDRPALRTIAVYSPLPGEVDFTATHQQLSGLNWVYPKVSGDALSFHPVNDPATELIAGAFGILEPADGLPAVAVHEIDVFICPGLAFDPRGGRLGRGTGFDLGQLPSGPEPAPGGGCAVCLPKPAVAWCDPGR